MIGLLGVLAAGAPADARSGTFDHSAFDALLRRHVAEGLVDYDGFKGPGFKAYLASLDRADPAALAPEERLAYWINVYNAYTIELINAHDERASIRNIKPSLGRAFASPWHEPLVRAGGRVYHLDSIEHAIIRKQFKEPRIHFALVCAALGCPPLRSEAYTGARLEAQLAEQARRFLLESPAKNRVDVSGAVVYGSPIYVSYYREDFGGSDAAIGRYLAGFYPEGPGRELLLSGRFKLVETEYDWTLNSPEQAARRAPRASGGR